MRVVKSVCSKKTGFFLGGKSLLSHRIYCQPTKCMISSRLSRSINGSKTELGLQNLRDYLRCKTLPTSISAFNLEQLHGALLVVIAATGKLFLRQSHHTHTNKNQQGADENHPPAPKS